jgi:hypothetical protein
MPKQVFAAAAILFLIGGTPGLYAAEIDILKKAEQAEQLPSFGPPRGKLTRATVRWRGQPPHFATSTLALSGGLPLGQHNDKHRFGEILREAGPPTRGE